MPRAKANPDPAVVTHEHADMPGVVFTITASRDGGYSVSRGDRVLFARASQLSAHFGAPRYPSNRLQAAAIEDAKLRINLAMSDLLR
jgi:hypothetical protein